MKALEAGNTMRWEPAGRSALRAAINSRAFVTFISSSGWEIASRFSWPTGPGLHRSDHGNPWLWPLATTGPSTRKGLRVLTRAPASKRTSRSPRPRSFRRSTSTWQNSQVPKEQRLRVQAPVSTPCQACSAVRFHGFLWERRRTKEG